MSAQEPTEPSTGSLPPPPPPTPAQAYPGTYAPVRPSNGMATAGLVLGITSIFVNTLFVPAILGIIFSSMGISRASALARSTGYDIGKGAAIAGLICAIIGVLNSLLWKWALLFLI